MLSCTCVYHFSGKENSAFPLLHNCFIGSSNTLVLRCIYSCIVAPNSVAFITSQNEEEELKIGMLLFCVPRVVPYPFFTLLANPWLSLVFPSLGRILISIAKLSYFSGIASNPPAISVCFPRLPDGNVQVCLVSRNFHKINSLLFFMFPVSMGNASQIHFLIDNSTQYL